MISENSLTLSSNLMRLKQMLLGEVSEEPFKDSPMGLALFVIFMFLVVILLANVLIAIVTDSYKVIQVSVFFLHCWVFVWPLPMCLYLCDCLLSSRIGSTSRGCLLDEPFGLCCRNGRYRERSVLEILRVQKERSSFGIGPDTGYVWEGSMEAND